MDNVTHSLTGLALARAGLNRYCPHATWLLVLSANAPDADVVTAWEGAFRYFQVHRGYTHALIALPFMAALSAAVVALIFRQRLPWGRALLLCSAGVASHLLIDLTNSYGIRLLLPFSSQWFHLDLNSLYDASIMTALVLAAIAPLFAKLVNREIGSRAPAPGRTSAILALSFFLVFDLGRGILHRRVINQLDALLYQNAPALQTAALPDAFSPLRWTAIVETAGTFQMLDANPFQPVDAEHAAVFYKPVVTPGLQALRQAEPFSFFLYFARFPVWGLETVTGERRNYVRYDLTDLRFGAPGQGSFHCIGLLQGSSQVVGKWFSYKSGVDLGRAPSRTQNR